MSDFDPDDPYKMTPRRWIAWKLVQLAHRIYDASYYTTVKIGGGGILIEENEYGAGITASTGLDAEMREFEDHDEALEHLVDGATITFGQKAERVDMLRRLATVWVLCENEQGARHDPDAPIPAWLIKYALDPKLVDRPPNWDVYARDVDPEDVDQWVRHFSDDEAGAET